MKRAIASAMLVTSLCVWVPSFAADIEIDKVFQSHAPDGQAYLVVRCYQIHDCFEDAYQYCKGPYQSLDKYPSAVGFRFECDIEPAPETKPSQTTQIRPGKGFPITEDYYPKESRKQGEQGMTVVKVCVSSTGRLTEPPTIEKISGYPRLDAAAIKFATAGDGHYVPATTDGKPVAACSKIGSDSRGEAGNALPRSDV